MSLYQEVILDHYANPRNARKLASPSRSVTVDNPLCGDRITMEIIIKDDVITDVAFSGKGCVISQSLSSQLTEYAKKKTKNELRKLKGTFMIKLLGMELGPNRLKCALLPLEALHKLLHD